MATTTIATVALPAKADVIIAATPCTLTVHNLGPKLVTLAPIRQADATCPSSAVSIQPKERAQLGIGEGWQIVASSPEAGQIEVQTITLDLN